MRSALSLFVLFMFAPGLQAGQQTIVASPQNLTGWTLVGAELAALSSQTELTLPAKAQLVRSVSATDIAVQLTTQPVIGESAVDWPVLEFGTAALIFTRNGKAGRLMVVIDHQPPVPLPFTFALDSSGRSIEILTVRFARDDSGVSATLAGQTQKIASGPITEQPMDIVVSAGASQSWIIHSLEGLALFPDPAPLPSPTGVLPSGSPGAGGPVAARSRLGVNISSPVAAPSRGGPVPAASVTGGKSLKSSSVTRVGALEVYTPPAVRHGRADAVRAAVRGPATK